jgi:hypothetical protein
LGTRATPRRRGDGPGYPVSLPGAHTRRIVKTSGLIFAYVSAWRGAGAPQIGAYSARSDAEIRAAMRADAARLAERYADARRGRRPTDTLAALLDRWQETRAFASVAASTQAERIRVIKAMKADVDPADPARKRLFVSLPASALSAKKARAIFVRWRDAVHAASGPRAADYRMQVLSAALTWAVDEGYAETNRALGIDPLYRSDRSELIWEACHDAQFFGHIRDEIARVWAATAPDDPNRWRQIARLAAARDAMILAQNTGMRRENLAVHAWRELQPPAIVYTALKGARRARTAGKKAKTTVLPILAPAARVYALRREATGAASPWVITSSRGGPYTPNALGKLVYDITGALGIERTLHDGKGTFVTNVARLGIFSDEEIADMVDWSVSDVRSVKRRYVSAPTIAAAMIERMKRKAGG